MRQPRFSGLSLLLFYLFLQLIGDLYLDLLGKLGVVFKELLHCVTPLGELRIAVGKP